jgi:hypothetical protein
MNLQIRKDRLKGKGRDSRFYIYRGVSRQRVKTVNGKELDWYSSMAVSELPAGGYIYKLFYGMSEGFSSKAEAERILGHIQRGEITV